MSESEGYEAKVVRCLTKEQLTKVIAAMTVMDRAASVVDGTLMVGNEDGSVIAEVWWDSESERWLADFWPSSSLT